MMFIKEQEVRQNSLLYLHLKTIAECRTTAQLPASACSITHPSCLSPEKGRSSRGEQAASICPEYLRQRGLYIRSLSLSHPFSHRSMLLPCHPNALENRTILACASSLNADIVHSGRWRAGASSPHTGPTSSVKLQRTEGC